MRSVNRGGLCDQDGTRAGERGSALPVTRRRQQRRGFCGGGFLGTLDPPSKARSHTQHLLTADHRNNKKERTIVFRRVTGSTGNANEASATTAICRNFLPHRKLTIEEMEIND